MLFVVLGAAVVLLVFVRWIEPRFAFFPLAGETTTPRDFGIDHETLAVQSSDVDAILQTAQSRAAGRIPVVYWGRSLDVSMAAYAAAKHAPAAADSRIGISGCEVANPGVAADGHSCAVLDVPLPRRRIPAARVEAAALVIHGDADTVVRVQTRPRAVRQHSRPQAVPHRPGRRSQ